MSKVEMMSAKDQKKGALVPRLRFPEFRDAGEWEPKKLDDICTRILQKVTDGSLIPVSITAGQGFVSQESKFGRNISGAQYKNYILLKHGDFAYNKGNSKKFPQGYVCQLKEFEQAAASSAFLCFRFTGKYQATFFQSLFDNNIHGKQLVKHITSSARSDGLLNIKPDVFFSILLPVPHLYSEQQRIADCLSSLDERIAAETRKLDTLKDHKKGLLKQLFPAEGETTPALRFPDFRGAGEWKKADFGTIATLLSGGTPSKDVSEYWGGDIPWISASSMHNTKIEKSDCNITKLAVSNGARIAQKGTLLLLVRGSMLHKRILLGISQVDVSFNQDVKAIVLNADITELYLMYFLIASESKLLAAVVQTGIGAGKLDTEYLNNFPIMMSSLIEQKRISDCLASLDELITAQSQKIDLLKDHKKGLMQQLFPRIDEVWA